MSKIIKVENHVYDELEGLKERRDTFSDVINQLLIARRRILETMNNLDGYLKVGKWREGQRSESAEATAPQPAAAPAPGK